MTLPKDDTANEQPDTHAFTVQAHLPQGGQATLRINKVTPAAGSSPETFTQIGQVKASASGADNLATFTLEDTFLDAASGLLEEGCKLRFVLDYQGKTYTLSSPMAVVTAPAAKAESGSTTIVPTTMDQEITPFVSPRRFPASAAISSRVGCPRSPFCSISRLPGTYCLAEDTNQPAI